MVKRAVLNEKTTRPNFGEEKGGDVHEVFSAKMRNAVSYSMAIIIIRARLLCVLNTLCKGAVLIIS